MFLKIPLVFTFAAALLLASAARTAEKATPSKEKEFIFKVVDRNSKAIALLGDNIYYFAELGLQEFETAKLMTQILEDAGFKVERGISGMPTAFMATYGSGKPVIAIHTEYDTTPGNSQTPGVPEHKPLVEDAPGHAEGHNVERGGHDRSGLCSKKGDGRIQASGDAQNIRRSGRGTFDSPALLRARWLFQGC
jgi:aminobenzoyl-glutamate utilization protein B